MASRVPARDRLAAAAGKVFYERGITSTCVDDVARAAGVSKPTVYAHFPSKSSLAAAGLSRRHRQRAAELRACVEQAQVHRRPLAVFAWLADWYRGQGERGCAFLNAAAELTDPDDPVRQAVRAEKQWLLEFFTGLCADAGLRDPERLASRLLLLVDGVAGRVVVEGPAAAPQAAADAADAAAVLVEAAGRS